MSKLHLHFRAFLIIFFVGYYFFVGSIFVLGMDVVIWRPSETGDEITSVGRTLEMAQDGGLLFQERNGGIHAIEPQMIVKGTRNNVAFTPFSREEMEENLREEFPKDFKIYRTKHYLICYNTSSTYARWCGNLLEGLYSAFQKFWEGKDFELLEPEFPLVMIIFSSVKDYKAYGADALGEMEDTIVGYYSIATNRMVCYDLTGAEVYAAMRKVSATVTYRALSRAILNRPQAEGQIATIIHEATHQLAHNRGMVARFADVPLWYNEGISLFFETPNMKSEKGWASAGRLNRSRAIQHKNYLVRRQEGSLRKMLSDDSILRSPETGADMYAEAWGLTYYFLKVRPEDFVKYAKKISTKKPLLWDDKEVRIQNFEECFGNVEEVERDFIKYMKKLKVK
ncbi:MAG: DUF1570 domain-containing protein [Planctomycetia bacterium]|nr:DUF1570 domain-containing protein [Planctomycetia bacterium]